MAAAKVGSNTTGGNTSGTSFATTNPQSPTAGNTLVLVISISKGSNTAATLSGLTGWTLMGSAYGDAGINSGGGYIFAKIAAGGDTAPTIGTSASVNLTWNMWEMSGLASTLISTGIPITGDLEIVTGSLNLTQARTSASANEFQIGAQVGRGATSNPAVTWGGGLTADYNTSSGRLSMLKTATGSIATSGGSMTGTCALTNNQGNAITGFIMVPFALAGGGPPPVVLPDVMVAGAEDPVNDLSVLVAGAADAVTDVNTMTGGARVPLVLTNCTGRKERHARTTPATARAARPRRLDTAAGPHLRHPGGSRTGGPRGHPHPRFRTGRPPPRRRDPRSRQPRPRQPPPARLTPAR